MGDMGEYFRELKKNGQRRRASNRESSAAMLRKHGIIYTTHNYGTHLIVRVGQQVVDFWPGTGLWQIRGEPRQYRGVDSLVALATRKETTDD